MSSSNSEASIVPFGQRLKDRAIRPRSAVCSQCRGTRRDIKGGGKCTACQDARGAALQTKTVLQAKVN